MHAPARMPADRSGATRALHRRYTGTSSGRHGKYKTHPGFALQSPVHDNHGKKMSLSAIQRHSMSMKDFQPPLPNGDNGNPAMRGFQTAHPRLELRRCARRGLRATQPIHPQKLLPPPIMLQQPVRRPAQDVMGQVKRLHRRQAVVRVVVPLRPPWKHCLVSLERPGRHVGKRPAHRFQPPPAGIQQQQPILGVGGGQFRPLGRQAKKKRGRESFRIG
jgi:hypothetical protein